ncbi:MAG: cysteine desulfurase family protein [Promethearchaeota archaeon]
MVKHRRIYLDNNATTSIDPEVWKVMKPYYLKNYGNPSSLHSMGQETRKVIEDSRKKIADFLHAKNPEEIIFTGGGTESDNMAILGTARKMKRENHGNHLITSNFEHAAVQNTFKHLIEEGFEVTEVPVDSEGIIHVEDIENAIRSNTILISVMYVNNEIGTIQPVEEIAALADSKGIIFHTDAVQAFGKIPINLSESKIHLLSASAHKIYGPKGLGLLYMRNKGTLPKIGQFIEPIIFGGGHEFGMRPSTENVPEILGFAKAVELAEKSWAEKEPERQKLLRDDFIKWVLENIPDSSLNGHPTKRMYNNIALRFKHIGGESLLLYLDKEGIEVSTGSACSSHFKGPSHVILALGLKNIGAKESLRISIGKSITKEDMEYTKIKLKECIARLRKISPLTN